MLLKDSFLTSFREKRNLAIEVLWNTYPIASAIRVGKLESIDNYLLSGRDEGMISIDESLRLLLRAGKISVVVRLSPTLLPGMDRDVPFAGDLLRDERDRRVYDFLTAPERLGRLFMVSAKSPADRISALRTAFDLMVIDRAFLAEAERSGLTVTPMSGPEVDRRIAELYATPPELVARARAVAAE